MNRLVKATGIATALLTAHPCVAAAELTDMPHQETRIGTFAGGTLRIPFGSSNSQVKPEARLQAGYARISRDPAAGNWRMKVSGVAIGEGKKGAPELYLGGIEVQDIKRRMGISTSGAIGIGVGVTLLALVAVAAASSPPDIGCALSDEPC